MNYLIFVEFDLARICCLHCFYQIEWSPETVGIRISQHLVQILDSEPRAELSALWIPVNFIALK